VRGGEFLTEELALLERVRHLSEVERREFLVHVEAELEAYKKRVVDDALGRDEWKGLPPESRLYRDLIFDLCFAQSLESPIVQKQGAVMAAINFLDEKGFPSTVIRPLRDLVGDLVDLENAEKLKGQPGRRRMSHNDQFQAAYAAAAVTVLSARETSVDEALKMVCKASGLDRKWLRQFRLNLLRGKGGPALISYKIALCGIDRGVPADEILKSLTTSLRN
jgi:hypothetical protein